MESYALAIVLLPAVYIYTQSLKCARRCREDAELALKGAAEQASAPASVTAFKQHPLYVLARHVTKFQALAPGTAPAGTHKCAPSERELDAILCHTACRATHCEPFRSRIPNTEPYHTPARQCRRALVSPSTMGMGGMWPGCLHSRAEAAVAGASATKPSPYAL